MRLKNINFGDFSISTLLNEDAVCLHEMLLRNKIRFQTYFPKTLEENATLNLTNLYIKAKETLIFSGEEYTLGIRDTKNEKIIGLVIVKNIDKNKDDGEVAYAIDVNYGGKGLITKAVSKMCTFAAKQLKLKSLYIIAHKTNFASVKVAEKSGFIWKLTKIKCCKPINETVAVDMEMFVKEL